MDTGYQVSVRHVTRELRLLWWPWCLMTLAGLSPLLKLSLPEKGADLDAVAVLGFFGGAAFLTALSFKPRGRAGLPLSADDAGRGRIWLEKMVALVAAIAGAGVLVCMLQLALGMLEWRELQSHNVVEPVLLLVIIACSTGFWTMLTRSMVGGLVSAGIAQFLLYGLLVLFVRVIDQMAPTGEGETRLSHVAEVHAALSWFVVGTGLSYAGVMLWFGRRRFKRSQCF